MIRIPALRRPKAVAIGAGKLAIAVSREPNAWLTGLRKQEEKPR
jgi:hypothetical protein